MVQNIRWFINSNKFGWNSTGNLRRTSGQWALHSFVVSLPLDQRAYCQIQTLWCWASHRVLQFEIRNFWRSFKTARWPRCFGIFLICNVDFSIKKKAILHKTIFSFPLIRPQIDWDHLRELHQIFERLAALTWNSHSCLACLISFKSRNLIFGATKDLWRFQVRSKLKSIRIKFNPIILFFKTAMKLSHGW